MWFPKAFHESGGAFSGGLQYDECGGKRHELRKRGWMV